MFAKLIRYSLETSSTLANTCAAAKTPTCSAMLAGNRLLGGLRFQSSNESTPKVNNSSLYQLRKSTGYALSKCKEALEKNNGNVEQATKYLHEMAQKEGWTKAEKLKNRNTSQGTLVLTFDKSQSHKAALIEINCETDFVARNEKFLDLSSQLALSVIKNAKTSGSKSLILKEDLVKLNYLNESKKTIGDQLALSIGSLGENMSIRRAVIFNLEPNQHLGWYMHGTSIDALNGCHFGKYGALVNLSLVDRNENYKPFEIGRQIAQQVVGMNPRSIGEMPAERPVLAEGEIIKIADNETRLLFQEFLMKPNTRVLDFLFENSARVNDFVRFECGEEFSSSDAAA